MSITEELRTYAQGYELTVNHKLLKIADRIDKAHEKALSEQFESLTYDMSPMTDENMAKDGWVKLPKDADGETIHMGDKLVEPEHVPNGGTVVAMKLYADWDHWLVNCGAWVDPRKCRHYHEPTAEDVLWEFTRDWCESACAGDMTNVERDAARANVIAKYAERIREAVKHEQ